MKLAVFSDTHCNIGWCIEAVNEHRPDAVVHLGDHDKDALELARAFPQLPMYSVCGNCDAAPFSPQKLVAQFGPIKVLMCHGHQYSVRQDVSRLVYAAQEEGASLVLFGHTHQPTQEELGGVKLINPGTAGKGSKQSWCMVEILPSGGIACTFHYRDKY